MTRNPLISLVVPSYNDADLLRKHLPPLLDHLKKNEILFEIIIADDGSDNPDETRLVAESLLCRYVRNPVNQGKGAAVRRGMLAAKGKYRIFTDADIPFTVSALDRMIHYLTFKEFDMVVGDRSLAQSVYTSNIPWLRRMGSSIYSFFLGRFFVGGWVDTQCGLKGFKDEVAEDLFGVGRINGFAFDVELLYIALKRNYDVKRIPVILQSQERSHVRIFRDGMRMLSDLCVIYAHGFFGHYRLRKRSAQPVIVEIDTKAANQKKRSAR